LKILKRPDKVNLLIGKKKLRKNKEKFRRLFKFLKKLLLQIY